VPLNGAPVPGVALPRLNRVKWEVGRRVQPGVLARGGAWMGRGCREGLLRPTLAGSLLLGGVCAARYFDLLDSLAVRGVVLLTVGAVLIAEAFCSVAPRQRVPGETEVGP